MRIGWEERRQPGRGRGWAVTYPDPVPDKGQTMPQGRSLESGCRSAPSAPSVPSVPSVPCVASGGRAVGGMGRGPSRDYTAPARCRMRAEWAGGGGDACCGLWRVHLRMAAPPHYPAPMPCLNALPQCPASMPCLNEGRTLRRWQGASQMAGPLAAFRSAQDASEPRLTDGETLRSRKSANCWRRWSRRGK